MKNPIQDLALLKVFCAVASLRSLKAAALKLGVTSSAVSQSLQTLEGGLSLQLLDRSCRPVRLTNAGRRLFAEGQAILESVENLHASMRAENLEKLDLRLGLTESVMETIGPWLLNELSEKVASLSTYSDFTTPILSRLKNETLDVIISPNPLIDEDRWARRLLFEEDFLIVTHKSITSIETMQDWLDVAEGYPLICYNLESSDQIQIDRIVRSIGMRPKRFAAVSSSYALVGLVTQKRGWTIMPPSNLWSARHFLKDVNCFKMPAGKRTSRQMWIVGDRFSQSAPIRLVYETASKVFREQMLAHYRSAPVDLSPYIRLVEGE